MVRWLSIIVLISNLAFAFHSGGGCSESCGCCCHNRFVGDATFREVSGKQGTGTVKVQLSKERVIFKANWSDNTETTSDYKVKWEGKDFFSLAGNLSGEACTGAGHCFGNLCQFHCGRADGTLVLGEKGQTIDWLGSSGLSVPGAAWDWRVNLKKTGQGCGCEEKP